MATVKVNEEETAIKYLTSKNYLSFIPLFVVGNYTTIEFIEHIKTKYNTIKFNPN